MKTLRKSRRGTLCGAGSRKSEVCKALKRIGGKGLMTSVDVWKCLGQMAAEFLTDLFNKVLERNVMREEWRRSVLMPTTRFRSCPELWQLQREDWLRVELSFCEQFSIGISNQ